MSIVESIIELAESEALKNNAKVISKLELDIGKVSGIEIKALNFAFNSIKHETMLKNAVIKINILKAKSKCEDCSFEYDVEDVYSLCPKCNSYKTNIIQGKEMKVKSISID